jgi:hypothetical protein
MHSSIVPIDPTSALRTNNANMKGATTIRATQVTLKEVPSLHHIVAIIIGVFGTHNVFSMTNKIQRQDVVTGNLAGPRLRIVLIPRRVSPENSAPVWGKTGAVRMRVQHVLQESSQKEEPRRVMAPRVRLVNTDRRELLRHQPRRAQTVLRENFPIRQESRRAPAPRVRLVSTDQPGLLPLRQRRAQTVQPAGTRPATVRRTACRAAPGSTQHHHRRPRAWIAWLESTRPTTRHHHAHLGVVPVSTQLPRGNQSSSRAPASPVPSTYTPPPGAPPPTTAPAPPASSAQQKVRARPAPRARTRLLRVAPPDAPSAQLRVSGLRHGVSRPTTVW